MYCTVNGAKSQVSTLNRVDIPTETVMTHNKILEQILFEHGLEDASIYSFQVLLEDRLSFIKAKYNGKLDSVVDNLSHIDPTPNKKFTEWLTERHLKGDDVFNPDVRQGLYHFAKAKSTAHDTNIKNHTVQSMLDVAHMTKVHNEITHKKPEDLEKLYDKDGVIGYRIPSKESSIANYGHGRKYSTSWCTASSGSGNMFDGYDGDKYTMHFPNGHFLQFHHDSNQCKDPSDSEIDFSTDKRYGPYSEHVREFMHQTAKNPGDHVLHESRFGISKESFDYHASKYDESDDHEIAVAKHADKYKLDDEIFGKLLNSGYTTKLSRNPHLTHDQMGHLIKRATDSRVASSPALRGEHLDTVFSDLASRHDENSPYLIGRMKNLEPKHVDRLIKGTINGNDNHSDALRGIAENRNYKFTDDQIRKIHNEITGAQHFVAKQIGTYQKLPDDVLDSAVKAHAESIRQGFVSHDVGEFAQHNNLSEHHMNTLVDAFTSRRHHGSTDIKTFEGLYKAPQLTYEHSARLSESVAKKTDYLPSLFADRNHNIPHDHMVHILRNNPVDEANVQGYISRRDAKSSVAEELATKNHIPHDSYAMEGLRGLKDFPKEKFGDPDHAPYVAMQLHKHPSANKDHISDLISGLEKWSTSHNATISTKMTKNILNHPNVNAGHINRILKNWGNDWMVHDEVNGHAKVPPSISNRLHNSFFEAE